MANPENIEGQGFHTNPERANRNGRPKGAKNRATLFREWMDMETDGESNERRVMRALMAKAQDGDVSAIKEALDSTFGKLTDKQELSGPDGGALQAIVRKVIDPKVIES